MKTNLYRTLMLTAAVMTLSAAAAYGQSGIGANIPFAFRTIGGVQAPGNYTIVSINSDSARVLQARNLDNHKSTLLAFGVPTGNSNDQRARLVFRCGDESGCALTQVWMGDGQGYAYATPRPKPSELEHVAVVYLDHKQSE